MGLTNGHTHRWEKTIVFPRRTRPIGGVDYGSEGRCIVEARSPDGALLRRLVWFPGFSTAAEGVRGSGRKYVPARLDDMAANEVLGTTLHADGGRLARPLLDRLRHDIDARYGQGTADAIRPGSTLIIGMPEEAATKTE